jgi:ribosomal protein S1
VLRSSTSATASKASCVPPNWLVTASKTRVPCSRSVEDARTVLKVGQEIEARFTGVDRKTRTIALSIKAKEIHEEAEAVSSYRSEQGSSSGTSLGDLLKEQIGDR